MQSDSATRILLASILLCLVILVVQSFVGSGARSAAIGRYSVTGMRAGTPILVRADSATGRVWKLDLRGTGEAGTWVEFPESGKVSAAAAPLDQPDQVGPDPGRGDQPLQ